ncbi:ABC transporter ATP-binding protein [Yunchengibacter salinarum]|uniref:ABC transporter ATP-binding protein n=1 Tax=Yunchengibacter salinarum TaxID=3133399 RepID=UPI0035B5FC3A
MIEAEGLTRRFDDTLAVDNVSLSVKQGEVLGFLGPNGAGKTTTMKMLTGYLAPTAGTARICGLPVTGGGAGARRRIGYLPEGAPLYGDMTPRAFLTFVARAHGLERGRIGSTVESAARAVHLDRVMEQRIDTLSKGFRRRVGLAAAILHAPDVLILDEPTDGLDPNQKHDVRNLIEMMARDRAIIISTHILEEVEALCSRAVIIHEGRLVADDSPSALRRRSRYVNAISMTVSSAIAADVRAVLDALPGVAGVEESHEGAVVRLTALSGDRGDISAPVAEAVERYGWDVDQFAIEGGRLDDVFFSLTRGESEEHAA